MYMHQSKLLHVHTTTVLGELVMNCHRAPAGLHLWSTPAHEREDSVALLVERALGRDARNYFRSSERRFPLLHQGNYFSVSHSDTIAVMGVADVPVGIDIELCLAQQASTDLAWAWSPDEQMEILGNDCQERVSTEIWTGKEAAGKALGVGLQAMPYTIASFPELADAAHRSIFMTTSLGRSARLDSHGVWLGRSHLRVAWVKQE